MVGKSCRRTLIRPWRCSCTWSPVSSRAGRGEHQPALESLTAAVRAQSLLTGVHILAPVIQLSPTTALFSAIFLLYPLLYYVVVSEERYRLPILWLSCLTAGYLLTAIPSRRRL